MFQGESRADNRGEVVTDVGEVKAQEDGRCIDVKFDPWFPEVEYQAQGQGEKVEACIGYLENLGNGGVRESLEEYGGIVTQKEEPIDSNNDIIHVMGVDERNEPAVFQVNDYEQCRDVPVPEKLQPCIGITPVCQVYDQNACYDEDIQDKDIPRLFEPHEDQDEEIKQDCRADGEAFFQTQAGIQSIKEVHDPCS